MYLFLPTTSRPGQATMCSITPDIAMVSSSCSHMRGPGVCQWFSDRSNCSHWSFEAAVVPIYPNIYTHWYEPIITYHSLHLLVVIQLCSPLSCHLHSNYCRKRSRQSELRCVLSPLLSHLHVLGIAVRVHTQVTCSPLGWCLLLPLG